MKWGLEFSFIAEYMYELYLTCFRRAPDENILNALERKVFHCIIHKHVNQKKRKDLLFNPFKKIVE